jgi:hypothetical protein
VTESAEAIAKVVADLRAGRIFDVYDAGLYATEIQDFESAVVVDATAVYYDLLKRKGVNLYDHRLAPVWPNSLICYRNEHGNGIVTHAEAVPLAEWDSTGDRWETNLEHTIDWDRVRWVYLFTIFSGHRAQGNTVAVPTAGPLHMWRAAVYGDGEIADLRWVAVSRDPDLNERWDMAQLITLGAINLGNCVNVELMEPKRSRHAQRRLDRSGVRVSELHVRPISKSYRGRRDGREPLGTVPIHSVRGHFAEYGVNGRGLLFGKYAGRYWIPAHARGNPEHGQVEQSYQVEP